jgi:hypothetical protein
MSIYIGLHLVLRELPDGCSTKDAPLTIGKSYKILGQDGSTLVFNDDAGNSIRIYQGRFYPPTDYLQQAQASDALLKDLSIRLKVPREQIPDKIQQMIKDLKELEQEQTNLLDKAENL